MGQPKEMLLTIGWSCTSINKKTSCRPSGKNAWLETMKEDRNQVDFRMHPETCGSTAIEQTKFARHPDHNGTAMPSYTARVIITVHKSSWPTSKISRPAEEQQLRR